MKALAVFHDHGCHWLDGWLKNGFRHCFAAVLAEGYWVRVDGLAGVLAVEVVAGGDFDLAAFYRKHGYAVVETEQRGKPLRAPFSVTNCVGLVKAVLAIRAPFALTPWRLYRHLLETDDAARKVDHLAAEAANPGGPAPAADAGRSRHRRGKAKGAVG